MGAGAGPARLVAMVTACSGGWVSSTAPIGFLMSISGGFLSRRCLITNAIDGGVLTPGVLTPTPVVAMCFGLLSPTAQKVTPWLVTMCSRSKQKRERSVGAKRARRLIWRSGIRTIRGTDVRTSLLHVCLSGSASRRRPSYGGQRATGLCRAHRICGRVPPFCRLGPATRGYQLLTCGIDSQATPALG